MFSMTSQSRDPILEKMGQRCMVYAVKCIITSYWVVLSTSYSGNNMKMTHN